MGVMATSVTEHAATMAEMISSKTIAREPVARGAIIAPTRTNAPIAMPRG